MAARTLSARKTVDDQSFGTLPLTRGRHTPLAPMVPATHGSSMHDAMLHGHARFAPSPARWVHATSRVRSPVPRRLSEKDAGATTLVRFRAVASSRAAKACACDEAIPTGRSHLVISRRYAPLVRAATWRMRADRVGAPLDRRHPLPLAKDTDWSRVDNACVNPHGPINFRAFPAPWGHSSAGRAPAWHAGGRRFDPAWLHQVSATGLRKWTKRFTASPSSRGLGHYPFTVATGVRIPVGTPLLQRLRAAARRP
jgi:hypothetical protein